MLNRPAPILGFFVSLLIPMAALANQPATAASPAATSSPSSVGTWGTTTTRVSVDSDERGFPSGSGGVVDVSRNGRFVLFGAIDPPLFFWRLYVRDTWAGLTELVSVNSREVPALGDSLEASMSANGRFVAFSSGASNLVPGDTNDHPEDEDSDVFVRDRKRGLTHRISLNSDGGQTVGNSFTPDMSANGRFVSFTSTGSDLVPGDTDLVADVFVRDLRTATTSLVSVPVVEEEPGVGWNDNSSISANGRFVVFDSDAANLVPGTSEYTGQVEVYLRDRRKGTTRLISLGPSNERGNTHSGLPEISANGRVVGFVSEASNLTLGDDNGVSDVFLYDASTMGALRRVSVTADGESGNGVSGGVSLSADGRTVAFLSEATNLVPGDLNQANDAFIYSPATGILRASVGVLGQEAAGWTYSVALSGDARAAAFSSTADNLVRGDRNGLEDVFLRRWQGR